MTTITRVIGSHDQKVIYIVVSRQNFLRKVLISCRLLLLLIGHLCCLFPQFQWIAYDVYHFIYYSNLYIAQELN